MPKPRNEDAGGGAMLRIRLRPAIEATGGVGRFAEQAGIPRDTFSKYLGGMQPSPTALVKMADASGLSIDYLLGRIDEEASSGMAMSQTLSMGALPEDFIPVPRLEVRASAGAGEIADQRQAAADIMLRGSWLRSLGIVPNNAEFLEARGDSMEPTIRDGDLMLVDRGYGEVVNGKIYVLVSDGLVLVKRVQILALGGLMLISDNERYPPQTIGRSDIESLRIEARVVWYGRAI